MSKETKKRNYYNTEFLNALQKMFGFGHDYLRKFLRGDRPGLMQDRIQTEYKRLENSEKVVVTKYLNK
ncbi:hypothetical protein SAMN04487935_3326 [Flavobacterium noncentrifugens]|uniref:Uncharacterized protein n=1 Tax=Flavobacterium noncentrifugens TaxID=1128970 RepID=A0A1G9BRX1_9FLAO|nr:hypothetical protein SAMN04487935_3326 [Flavobacterium noncentrifugens]